MLERKVILAVGAHQDDAEFYMSSPLFLLGDDWEKHIATFANGSCGTSIPGIPRIVGIRTTEAENAAKLAKAEFHCGEYPDVGFVVDNDTLAAATALIRKIRPSIVITHHWEDYMLDHTATSELIREGCFRRGLVNYTTRPQLPPYADNESYKADICLYYAQPHLNRRNNGEFVEPGMFIDVSDKMREIIKMLRKHESQYDWLKDTQGGNYVITLLKKYKRARHFIRSI